LRGDVAFTLELFAGEGGGHCEGIQAAVSIAMGSYKRTWRSPRGPLTCDIVKMKRSVAVLPIK
jgi:hypothetical protein